MSKLMLHMGCGEEYLEGWLNIDLREDVKVDKLLDLDVLPLPFGDDTFDEILAVHVLEHFKTMLLNPISYMEELWRISKPNCKITIEVPYGPDFWGQLDQKKGFSYSSFLLLGDDNKDRHTFSPARFKVSFKTKPTKLGRLIPNFPIPFSSYGFRDSLALVIGQINFSIRFELMVMK